MSRVISDEVNKYSKKISEKLLEEFLRESIDLTKIISFSVEDRTEVFENVTIDT